METAKIIECPRDAWQGLPQQIPTEVKAAYLRRLVESGFRHIDAVSFVSPKHVRQMADSEAVLDAFFSSLTSGTEPPEIIGIVVNEKGAERALAAHGVTTLGYPYSISAYFRRANANMSRAESRTLVEQLRKETKSAGRDLVVYISMAFGNPYEEPWGPEIVEETLIWLKDTGVRTVSLADTVGTATPAEVGALYTAVKDCVAGKRAAAQSRERGIKPPASRIVRGQDLFGCAFRPAVQVYAEFDAGDAVLRGGVYRADFGGSGRADGIGQRNRAHAGVFQPNQSFLDDLRPPGLLVGIAEGHGNVHH